MNEARLRQILHEIVYDLVTHLFIGGVHNRGDVQDMVDRLHRRIDTLGDE
jgi:hypothetical protein